MSDVLHPYRDLFPQIGQRVMIDDSSVVIGDVRLADDVGIWPLVVIRGDVHYVQIGARTNIQDGSMLHVTHKSSYNPDGNPLNGMLLAGFVAGLFATGGQSVLYALAPLFYSSQIRATGVGTAVAVGRLGAMSGPLLAGKMLALGTGTVGVMAASAPGILVAGLAVFILMSRRSRIQPCADA